MVNDEITRVLSNERKAKPTVKDDNEKKHFEKVLNRPQSDNPLVVESVGDVIAEKT